MITQPSDRHHHGLRDWRVEVGAAAFGGITSPGWAFAADWEREQVRDGIARALAAIDGRQATTDSMASDVDALIQRIRRTLLSAVQLPGEDTNVWTARQAQFVYELIAPLIAERAPDKDGHVDLGGGLIQQVAFSDGRDDGPDCGYEACECPAHEYGPLAAGTYVTIRLDEDHAVGLWRARLEAFQPERKAQVGK